LRVLVRVELMLLVLMACLSLVASEFVLVKSNSYKRRKREIISIKFKNTKCRELFEDRGIAKKLKASYSSDCLPIGADGKDLDDIKLLGTCINLKNGASVLRVFELQDKSDSKTLSRKTQFYLRLKSSSKVKFEVKTFALRSSDGHMYVEQRPRCGRAIDFCEEEKDGKPVTRVTRCVRGSVEERNKLEAGKPLYLEITKRSRRPKICRGEKGCCAYITSATGICPLKETRKEYIDESFREDRSVGLAEGSGKEKQDSEFEEGEEFDPNDK